MGPGAGGTGHLSGLEGQGGTAGLSASSPWTLCTTFNSALNTRDWQGFTPTGDHKTPCPRHRYPHMRRGQSWGPSEACTPFISFIPMYSTRVGRNLPKLPPWVPPSVCLIANPQVPWKLGLCGSSPRSCPLQPEPRPARRTRLSSKGWMRGRAMSRWANQACQSSREGRGGSDSSPGNLVGSHQGHKDH